MRIRLAAISLTSVFFLTGCVSAAFDSSTSPELVPSSKAASPIQTEVVTDEFGSYTRDSSAAIDFDWERSDQTFLSDDEDAELKAWIANFIWTEALDSIALDNTAAWDKWAREVAPKYLHSDYIDKLLNAKAPVIMADKKYADMKQGEDLIPTLFRDGGVRVSEKKVLESGISRSLDDRDVFYVNVSGTMESQAEDEKYLDWYLFNEDLYSEPAPDAYYEAWRNDPIYNDGIPEKIHVDFTISYTVTKENGIWKITGFENIFSVGI